jgi:hypothetical protein
MTWIGARDEWSLDGGDTSGWELTIKPSGTTELPTWHIFTTRVASESGDSVVVSVKKSFDNLGDITNTPVPSIAQFDKNGDSRINKQEAIDAVNNFLLNKHTEKEVAIVAVNGFLLQKGVAQLQVQLQQLWQQKIARIQSMVQSASKFNLSNTITLPKP